MTRSVYIICPNPFHDYSVAEDYGKVKYLTTAPINQNDTRTMLTVFSAGLRYSKPEDTLILSGYNVMNVIACSLFSVMHSTLNVMIFKTDHYIEKTINLKEES